MRTFGVILLLFSCCSLLSQTRISHFHDIDNSFSIENIRYADFSVDGGVNNGLNNGKYWIKVEGISQPSIIQIPNDHITLVKAYHNNIEIEHSRNERFVTYRVDDSPVYIQVIADREAYIPVRVERQESYAYAEKKDLLFIGFYYGFVVAVILLNLLYFQSFRDITFFYYSLFLFAVSYGLFIKDGAFHLFGLNQDFILFNEVIIHVAAAVICGYFSTSYLSLDEHFTWLKPTRVVLNIVMILTGSIYLITRDFFFFIAMDAVVFSVLTFYWSFGWLFVKRNVFTRLFVFSFMLILFSGINFFVAQLFGFTLLNVNAAHLNKAGGFVEMLLLSFGVFYRMRTIQNENKHMRQEVLLFIEKINTLSAELEKNKSGSSNLLLKYDLSIRENEILGLLHNGRSNKEIAELLFISTNTVKYHIKNIYQKLQISSRKEVHKFKQ